MDGKTPGIFFIQKSGNPVKLDYIVSFIYVIDLCIRSILTTFNKGDDDDDDDDGDDDKPAEREVCNVHACECMFVCICIRCEAHVNRGNRQTERQTDRHTDRQTMRL